MFNNKFIKGITYYPLKLKISLDKKVSLFKYNYFKKKIVNGLNIDIIDKLCINDMRNVAKFVLETFGFSKVAPYENCCLKESSRTIVMQKNNKNYLIKFSNNKNTICVNKIAMYSVVGACDYNCVKTVLISNHEFNNDVLQFAKDLNMLLIDRSYIEKILDKVKKFKNINKKEKVIKKLIGDLI